MQNELGPDTIFYTIKLKRTKTPVEVFEKMQKAVKKKVLRKNGFVISTTKIRS